MVLGKRKGCCRIDGETAEIMLRERESEWAGSDGKVGSTPIFPDHGGGYELLLLLNKSVQGGH